MTIRDVFRHIIAFFVYLVTILVRSLQFRRQQQNTPLMKTAILGLGNPTILYKNTRHNIGKDFVLHLVKSRRLDQHKQAKTFTSYIYKNCVLAVSQSYMNLSASAVQNIIKTYPGLSLSNIYIVHDDLEHKIGNARFKKSGLSRGHRGIISISNKYGTKDILRLQLGIGRPESRDPSVISDYVLAKFKKEEISKLYQSYEKAEQLLKSQGVF